ncbi:unnamed protein product [Pocillopora meandrina]|uniref:THAP-type domain-containing protein n=1 Tax=Pocillopora meandrina TaxID=46732 RepID=A0AAU9XIH7_9CNID|nr:unnamed protein product [Pocillopora meandrina]
MQEVCNCKETGNDYHKSQGLTFKRERTGQSLLRLDPTGVLQRWLNSIRRGRIYSVPCSRALWHIDKKKFINSKAQILTLENTKKKQ